MQRGDKYKKIKDKIKIKIFKNQFPLLMNKENFQH